MRHLCALLTSLKSRSMLAVTSQESLGVTRCMHMDNYKRERQASAKQTIDIMQSLVLFALCCLAATLVVTASESQKAVEQSYLPRYTLLAESKKKEQDLERQPHDVDVSEQQPWRRLAYASFGSQHSSTGCQGTSPAPLLGPGLMLLGVNLGALLYMLLALLGLAPQQRIGFWRGGDIYRNDRQHLGAGKETDMYL